MNYTRKSFSVSSPAGEEYRSRWQETFKDEPRDEKCRSALFTASGKRPCLLEPGHGGDHQYADAK